MISKKTRALLARLAVILAVAALAICPTAPARASTSRPVYKIPTSIASDCSVDVSAALLSWIGSLPNSSTPTFGSGKCYRVESTLEIRSRANLTFAGNGSTFKSFNAPDDQRAIWRIIGSTGMVFRNMAVVGSYSAGGTFNGALQHAHGFDLRGSAVKLVSTDVSDVAGDCVYFGLGYDSATKSSGSYITSSCAGTSRNGVSVTAGENVTISQDTLDQIGYTGVDVEPNQGAGWGASNIAVDQLTLGRYYLYSLGVVENAPIGGVSITNSHITDPKGLKVAAVAPGGVIARPTNLTVTDNTADHPSSLEAHHVDGITYGRNTPALSTTFDDCTNIVQVGAL